MAGKSSMLSELPPTICLLLPHKIQDFKMSIINKETVGESACFLLNKCVNYFYHKESTELERGTVAADLSDCLNTSKILLDITWEKLNTGYWKDVHISWRYLYSYASLLKVLCLLLDNSIRKQDVIKACDMGLMMGAPILKNVLCKIASQLSVETMITVPVAEENNELKFQLTAKSKRRKTGHCVEPKLDDNCLVPAQHCLSVDAFETEYMDKKQPVILKGVINNWPALSSRKWNIDYLLSVAGCRTVPIEIGSKYTDENWTQKLMTMEEFISTYIWNSDENKNVGYLAQHELFDQIPQLRKDISIPTYCCLTDSDNDDVDIDINAWFGPPNTVSPLHFDPKHNLLAQVMGEKYIRLYHEDTTASLYPTDSRLLNNTSQVDVENPDHQQFPLFSTAPYKECILMPGELLYIPAKCWHYVRSTSVSFSINFWWQ